MSAKVERISSVIILATLACKICVNVMVYNFLIHVFDQFIAFIVDPFHSNMNLVLNLPAPCSSSLGSIFCDALEGKPQALIRGIEGGASPRRRNVSILPLQNKSIGAKKLELKNASYLLET